MARRARARSNTSSLSRRRTVPTRTKRDERRTRARRRAQRFPRRPSEGLLRKVELHGSLPLAHTCSAVVIVHVPFGCGVLGPTVAGRIGGAARRLGTVAGVPVSGLLSARGVAAEGPPRVRPVVRARRTAGLRCAVLLSAVPIPGSRGTARSPARLAVSVPLRAPRRSGSSFSGLPAGPRCGGGACPRGTALFTSTRLPSMSWYRF